MLCQVSPPQNDDDKDREISNNAQDLFQYENASEDRHTWLVNGILNRENL
jgi:hypothetical protein